METIIASGTFDRLHEGHKFFLKKACEYAYVLIGLTSDEMVQSKEHAEKIWGFEKRKREIKKFLTACGFIEGEKYEIIKIHDKYGFALQRAADYILVTDDTYATAVKINTRRKDKGLDALEIVTIDLIKDEGGTISSTRLRS
jgi:cytidyltransferase-like protein